MKSTIIGLSIGILFSVLMILIAPLTPRQTLGLSNYVFLGAVTIFTTLLGIYWRQTKQTIHHFLTEPVHPMNISIFRIVLFSYLFTFIDQVDPLTFSRLPDSLRFYPFGTELLFTPITFDLNIISMLITFYKVLCVMAACGLMTRVSILILLPLSFFLLGIPQIFGKVNHYNHFIWFIAICAVSRVGDFFSFDAVIRAVKRADQGIVTPPVTSNAYGLPLKLMWILMGVVYFFPGFWKLWDVGFYWALSDNMKLHMYDKWFELGGWTPFFPIDQYPLLYKLAGLGTILFELTFIILIFIPMLRYMVFIGGLLFHNGIGLFMRIFFIQLQVCYVMFFNWAKIFAWIGKWLFKNKMIVLYDGNCELCRRTAAIIQSIDLLQCLEFINLLDKEMMKERGFDHLDLQDLVKDIHMIVEKNIYKGFDGYRQMTYRLPLLWITIPLLYCWPIPMIGNKIYRKVADSRTCKLVSKVTPNKELLRPQKVSFLTIIVGIVLISGNVAMGVAGVDAGWPFASYPKFSYLQREQVKRVEVVVSKNGQQEIFDVYNIEQFSSERIRSLVGRILALKDPEEQTEKLKILWQVLVEFNPAELETVTNVEFYRSVYWILPEKKDQNPVSRELLLSFQPNS